MNNQELSSIHASPYSEIIAVIFVIIVLINIIFVIIIFIVAMSSPVIVLNSIINFTVYY